MHKNTIIPTGCEVSEGKFDLLPSEKIFLGGDFQGQLRGVPSVIPPLIFDRSYIKPWGVKIDIKRPSRGKKGGEIAEKSWKTDTNFPYFIQQGLGKNFTSATSSRTFFGQKKNIWKQAEGGEIPNL